jgi:hypothetical protein
MPITIDPELEARIREKASLNGLSVSAYVERLINAELSVEEELASLALEGLQSGEPVSIGPTYWEDKHRRLDDRLGSTKEIKP